MTAAAEAAAAEAAAAKVLGKDKESWAVMNDIEKAAAVSLGYDEAAWEDGLTTDYTDIWWRELSRDKQSAAENLGYDEASWDAECKSGKAAEAAAAEAAAAECDEARRNLKAILDSPPNWEEPSAPVLWSLSDARLALGQPVKVPVLPTEHEVPDDDAE